MRYVPIAEVEPGMVSTGSLYDYDGKIFIYNKKWIKYSFK